MNILMRSVMVADKADKADLAYQNFLTLHQAGLSFDVAEDVVLWGYISDFGMMHNHAPDISTLRAHFTSVREDGVVSRLEALVMYQPLYRGDFEVRLTKRTDEKRVRTMQDLLRDAASITQTGLEIKEEKSKKILLGPIDAMNYLLDRAHEIVAPVTNARLAGEVTNDTDDFLAEYERRKADPLSGIGQFTGLSQMDDALSGAKKYELWTHAAFTGHMKCVAGDTRIFDLAAGRLRTVAEIHESQDAPIVHALDEANWSMTTAQATPVVQSGIRPILKLTSHKGRSIRVSDNHPFMLPQGWTDVKDVKVGDTVAVQCHEANEDASKAGNIRWEQVVSIEPDGLEMTYDLSVPGPANFVANGFITHNSTLMLNWAYNQAVYYGHSNLIFSLEMPYDQVRRILMALHSLHPRFRQIRIDLGLQIDPNTDTGLPYQNMRDGSLSDNEEMFLREYVAPDFKGLQVVPPMHIDPSGGYGHLHIEVAPPDKTDFTIMDVKARAEVLYQKSPFQMLFLDHMGLMAPRKWVQSTTERLNEVLRDTKRLAMNFNRGQGMAVVGLFQLSREGFKAAEKNEGNYNLTHLSYSNEAERSSDIVTTSYISDVMRKENKVRFQCLKSRDNKPFEPFFSRVEWPYRRILNTNDYDMIEGQKEAIGDAIDEASR